MGYEIFTYHPETESRRIQDFNSWLFWAKENAPWTGVSVPDVAALLKVICAEPSLGAVCDKLDAGGHLSLEEAAQLLHRAADAMSEKVRHVFETAVRNEYGVRVMFTQSVFDASASGFLARNGMR
jgi:hypothetical protein